MLPNEIIQSDLLDILFENRNKNYGAYALRKSYHKRLAAALTATLFVAAGFSILQLLHRNKTQDHVQIISLVDDPHLASIEPAKPQPIRKPVQPVRLRQIDYQTPVITSEDLGKPQPTVEDLAGSMVGNETIDGDVVHEDIVVSPVSNTEYGKPVAVAPAPADDGPLTVAESMPEFPGGTTALKTFLLKNIRQPDDLQAGERIVVLASFVVSKNGMIENAKIVGSGRTDLDREILRVIAKMPAWKPGLQNGHEVAVYFNLPVTFLGAEEE